MYVVSVLLDLAALTSMLSGFGRVHFDKDRNVSMGHNRAIVTRRLMDATPRKLCELQIKIPFLLLALLLWGRVSSLLLGHPPLSFSLLLTVIFQFALLSEYGVRSKTIQCEHDLEVLLTLATLSLPYWRMVGWGQAHQATKTEADLRPLPQVLGPLVLQCSTSSSLPQCSCNHCPDTSCLTFPHVNSRSQN
jgi:hypothetical protein